LGAATNRKYDETVSTACDSLGCIVVDTIDTALECVEMKNKKLF
jgi:hypothetical protein